MWAKFKKTVYEKIIKPFLDSHSPRSELALAAFLGMFWAMTPLVGIQMLLVFLNWLIFRWLRLPFYLPCALAMVWISNPFTMGPLYFTFYLCGGLVLSWIGWPVDWISFSNFSQVLTSSLQMELWPGLLHWIEYISEYLLFPMFIGCPLLAVPSSLLAYFLTFYLIKSFRLRKATDAGLTLTEWENQHVYLQK